MKRRITWILVVLLLAGGLTAGYFYAQSAGSRSPFRSAPVTRGPLTAAISATGTLNAVITVQVGSQVSGQIKELYADFNSQVKKDQIIARIDPDVFDAKVNQAKAQVDGAKASVLNQQAALERARADLGNARAAVAVAKAQTAKARVSVIDSKRDLGRKRDLRQQGFIAQADEDSAQATYDSSVAQHEANQAQEQAQDAAVRSSEAALKVADAQLQSAVAQVGQQEANLRQAQLDLEHTIIRAPVDGVVVSRTVDVGQTVAASLQAPTLFTIAQDLTKMQVDTNVDEADVSRVRVGMAAGFTVDSFPGQFFTGEIVQIRKAPQVVQNVVTYDVVVSAQNTDGKLLPGMTANARIVTEQRHDALRVPNAALRFRPPGVEADRPQRPGAGGMTGGGRGPSGSPRAGGAGGLPGRVWVIGPTGKPENVSIKLGITDGTNTEVVEGPLQDKQEVIVGLGAAMPRPATPGGPRL
jgi:HlyD family secretion protein